LEAEEKKQSFTRKSWKKNAKKEEESQDDKPIISVDPSQHMSIYTEEELREMEKEEIVESNVDIDEEVDYDEYDEYYDEDEK